MSENQKYIACLRDVAIQQHDIDTIAKPHSWVNDAIIHIYGRIVEKKVNESDLDNKPILFVAPCTVQFLRFFQVDDEVQDCIQSLKIENFKSVFFPITNGTSFTSTGNHWCLLILLPSKRTFLYCDSIRNNGNIPMAKSLIKRLKTFLNYKKTDLVIMDLPNQKNSYDCGVFIMSYMEYFAEHGNFDGIEKSVDQSKMSEFRKNYTQQILNFKNENQT